MKAIPSFFVDGFYIEAEDEMAEGNSPIDALFASLRSEDLTFIPTIGLDRIDDYNESVKLAVQQDQRGCCLRLWEPDLEGFAELGAQIGALLEFLSVAPKDVDLIVDFGPKVPAKSALPFIIDSLPNLNEWRTLTFAASSFPSSLIELKQNRIGELERDEWIAWLSVRSKAKSVKRVPTYGDYGISHPVITEVDPRIMLMSPNIRYTGNLNFVIAEGQAQPRKKKARRRARRV